MKKILVIDDLRYFGETYKNREVDYARTSEEGIKALKDWEQYEAIFLDHDLGEGDTAVRCGRFLEELSFENKEARKIKILIVSDNGPGRKELELTTRFFDKLKSLPKSQTPPEKTHGR